MNELDAFRIYMALKLHFSSKSYDVFESKGRVANINVENLEKNKTRFQMLRRVSRQFNTPADLVSYFVAQYAYANNSAIYNPMIAEENHDKWQGRKNSTTQNIIFQLEGFDLDGIVREDPPEIFKLVMRDTIHIETAVALNKIRPYIKDNYLALGEMGFKIDKLRGFVKFDLVRVIQQLGMENEEATFV